MEIKREIERKWLLNNNTAKELIGDSMPISILQYYKNRRTRYRCTIGTHGINSIYEKTTKLGGGLIRIELNKEINHKKWIDISKCCGLFKTRYMCHVRRHKAEIDYFPRLGIYIVEVEFKSKKDAESFRVPNFFGEEITGKKEYYNYYLAKKGEKD